MVSWLWMALSGATRARSGEGAELEGAGEAVDGGAGESVGLARLLAVAATACETCFGV